MRNRVLLWLALAGALLAGQALVPTLAQTVAQNAGPLTSLRGEIAVDETGPASATVGQAKPTAGFGRAYRQQPPLIPHRVDGYQVNKDFNKCLSCHAWPQNAQFNAPKVSETHYATRDGEPTDEVSRARWFCTQCHVPQADAEPLVPNAFKNAREVGGAFK